MCEESGRKFEVRLYLQNPLSNVELKELLSHIQGPIASSVRVKDSKFKLADSTRLNLSDVDSIASFLSSNGHLMERPILYTGEVSCIGRPLENLIPLL
jgi:arsenate reductase-like glutaredoxin family protein